MRSTLFSPVRERLTGQNRETERGKRLLCACGRQRVVCFRPRMVENGANFLPTFACAVLTIWTPGRISLGWRDEKKQYFLPGWFCVQLPPPVIGRDGHSQATSETECSRTGYCNWPKIQNEESVSIQIFSETGSKFGRHHINLKLTWVPLLGRPYLACTTSLFGFAPCSHFQDGWLETQAQTELASSGGSGVFSRWLL